MDATRTTQRKRYLRRLLALLLTLAALGQNCLFPAVPTAQAAEEKANEIIFYRWGERIKSRVTLGKILNTRKRVMITSFDQGKKDRGEYMLCFRRVGYTDGERMFQVTDRDEITSSNFNWYAEYASDQPFYTIGHMNCPEMVSYDDGFGVIVDINNKMRGLLVPDDVFDLAEDDSNFTKFKVNEIKHDGKFVAFEIWHDESPGTDEGWYLKNGALWAADGHYMQSQIMIGEPYSARVIDPSASEIINGQTTVFGQPLAYIPPGMTLTVRNGGVLVVSGALLNDGKIVVEEGGMLLLKPYSAIMPYSWEKDNSGGIINHGNIVIQEDALLIGGGVNGIQIKGGAVVNFGLMMSESFVIRAPYLVENKSTGAIVAGYGGVGVSLRNTVMDKAIKNNGGGSMSQIIDTSYIRYFNQSDFNWLCRTSLTPSSRKILIDANGIYGDGVVFADKNNYVSEKYGYKQVQFLEYTQLLKPGDVLSDSYGWQIIESLPLGAITKVETINTANENNGIWVPNWSITVYSDMGYGEESFVINEDTFAIITPMMSKKQLAVLIKDEDETWLAYQGNAYEFDPTVLYLSK